MTPCLEHLHSIHEQNNSRTTKPLYAILLRPSTLRDHHHSTHEQPNLYLIEQRALCRQSALPSHSHCPPDTATLQIVRYAILQTSILQDHQYDSIHEQTNSRTIITNLFPSYNITNQKPWMDDDYDNDWAGGGGGGGWKLWMLLQEEFQFFRRVPTCRYWYKVKLFASHWI